ncbi:hypothetical protein NMY22_g18350 [Coprinellus aureogranulatus]|nr:hypothetical protein NMY22_g18350 [Coprinellus aureogranulatus]
MGSTCPCLGYAIVIGENTRLISGGQAQRPQIAYALEQPSIFDACAWALDTDTQAAVKMNTIRAVKEGRAKILVVHKVRIMLICDRIIVDNGEVKEHV